MYTRKIPALLWWVLLQVVSATAQAETVYFNWLKNASGDFYSSNWCDSSRNCELTYGYLGSVVTSCNNSLPNAPNIVAEVACGGNIRLGNGSVTLERLDLNSGSLTVDGATLDIAGLNNSDYGSQRTMRFVLDSGEVRVSSLDWTDGAEFHLNGGTLTLKTVQSESYVGPGSVVIRNGSSFYQKSGVVTGENIGLYDPYSAGVIQIINAKGSDNTKFDALSGSYTLENGEIRNISLMVFGEFRVLNPQVELFLKSLHFDSIYRVPLLRWF